MDDKAASVKGTKHKFAIQYNSVVILTFTFLSLAVLLLGMATDGRSTVFMFSAYKTSWTDPMQYVRLFTHVLGHANFEHYLSNFMIILLVGPMLEEKYGSKQILILMIVTAFITGLINVLFFKEALLGASGIDFMLILLSSYANFEKGKIPLTLILVVFAFVGREIADGLFAEDNISQLTHIIGGAVGGVVGYFTSGEGKRIKKYEDEGIASTVAPAVAPTVTPAVMPVEETETAAAAETAEISETKEDLTK